MSEKKLTKAQRVYLAKHNGDKTLAWGAGNYPTRPFIERMEAAGVINVIGWSTYRSSFVGTKITKAGRAALKSASTS